MWELITEEIPFEGQAPLKYVMKGIPVTINALLLDSDNFRVASDVAYNNIRPNIPSTFPDDLIDLMKSCWHDKPNKRCIFI